MAPPASAVVPGVAKAARGASETLGPEVVRTGGNAVEPTYVQHGRSNAAWTGAPGNRQCGHAACVVLCAMRTPDAQT
jgi:hypothetical protein